MQEELIALTFLLTLKDVRRFHEISQYQEQCRVGAPGTQERLDFGVE
jgi:hypothetical protein